MLIFTKWFYLVSAVLLVAGGAMGYARVRSVVSLVAGVICGLLLVAAFLLLPRHLNPALLIGLVVWVALLGQFLPRLLHHEFKPHILFTTVLAVLGVVFTIVSWYR